MNTQGLIANLARRVASLERQLADTQRNLERQAEELEEVRHTQQSPSPWATKEEVIELSRKVNHITKYDLGWERMGPGRIPNIEISVSAIKSELSEVLCKLDDLIDEVNEAEDCR